ncbi:23S rRNA (uridine(2552)-2'-O)-methyltransferase RlmE [Thiomicrospira cyclica]|uniref:Ribosomal RNA large subunit methyltransferase E n=1 Tax=Thiomicrospira cyclica (strain DSM 14477 / JCM 11371 / ALM1) TaxID=717773 RepID=F6DC17_THICA|nr:23S rRNA (uridine(2552)-2'-O)-methyltransferase RlmE [Thiomicrospira cyclica]AEG31403.1 Ribosomal RNA large subunit methyltransferase E [Thiomicrospira cyclica ALM1]
MARSKSSSRWLQEHFDDPYVLQAQKEGWRSRAIYKLKEINEKDQLIKPDMLVIDLGAAPGGWSQYAAQQVSHAGEVLALDILPVESYAGVRFLQGDFTEESVFEKLLDLINKRPVDLVMSDMAPNFSGNKGVDIPRAMYLVELTLDLASRVLKPGGNVLMKVFQGEGYEQLLATMRQDYCKVITRKPQASRARSSEIYLLGLKKR